MLHASSSRANTFVPVLALRAPRLHALSRLSPLYAPLRPRASHRLRVTCVGDARGAARASLRHLRQQLQMAVAAQRFGDAATLRDAVRDAELALAGDEETAVLAANDLFYDAFRAGDADAIAAAWLHNDSVSCAHPLSGLAVGFDDVVDSWRTVFAMGKPTRVDVVEIVVNVKTNMAWLVCEQDIEAMRGSFTIGGLRVATNVFQKKKGRWYMVHYHASPVLMPEAEGKADS